MTEHIGALDPTTGRWPALTVLRGLLVDRHVSAADLVAGCLDRIAAVDPAVHAVLALDPEAMAQASACDRRLAAGTPRPLEGIPVLIKDNIDTAGLATTAGSRLLAGIPPRRDSDLVTLLRAAGAIVLGKTNLSEWANFRSPSAAEGWSAVGGQTRNPYALDHSPWGSSSGSAVAVAAGMAPVAIGTETDGSVVCPAAACGVVGVKPELGLLPGRGIVPISTMLDTPGVLATSVTDAAVVLAAITDITERGHSPVLAGQRIGLWPGRRPGPHVPALLDQVAAALRAAGAYPGPVELPVDRQPLDEGLTALIAEFAPSLNAYLRAREGAPADLAAVLDGNRADPAEMVFGQDLMEVAAAVTDAERAAALPLRERARRWARTALDAALAGGLDCVVAATGPPAWPIDHDAGDPPAATTSTIPALAGRPNISVPVGFVGDLPVGVSVFGPAGTGTVLDLAAGVEAACGQRRTPLFRAGPITTCP